MVVVDDKRDLVFWYMPKSAGRLFCSKSRHDQIFKYFTLSHDSLEKNSDFLSFRQSYRGFNVFLIGFR